MVAWFPGLTGVIDKGFGGSRSGNSINGVVLHHTANGGGKSALDYVANANSRNSHPTYLVQTGGQSYGIVHPDRRPYSTAGRPDPEAVTFEIDNSGGAPNWPVSDAALSTVAAIIAYHYKNSPKFGKGIARNKVGVAQSEFFVAWHSQYVATACPGPHILAVLDTLIAMALTIANGGTPPVVPPDTTEERKAQVRKIGTYLNTQGLASFRTAAADDGIAIDPGETYSRYYHLVQLWGAREGVYDTTVNSIDGIVGPNTRRVEGIIWARLNVPAKPDEPPVKVGDVFTTGLPFKVFSTAANAISNTNSTGTYQAGQYTVFKVEGLALNVTKTAGKAGGWTTFDTLGYPVPDPDPVPEPVMHSVTFNSDGGTPVPAPFTVKDGETIQLPGVVKDGFTFVGWFNGDSAFTATTKVYSDLTLVARWLEVVDPDPEPEPDNDAAELFAAYLAEVAPINTKYTGLFENLEDE